MPEDGAPQDRVGDYRLEALEDPDPRSLEDLVGPLADEVFGASEGRSFPARLAGKAAVLALVARAPDGQVAAFKVGFEDRPGRFYSWLGAVAPAHRRQGLGRALMRRQHAWAAAQGYATLRTNTKNTWRSMLILNLQEGFDVIGAFTDARGEPKLILEKRLADPEKRLADPGEPPTG